MLERLGGGVYHSARLLFSLSSKTPSTQRTSCTLIFLFFFNQLKKKNPVICNKHDTFKALGKNRVSQEKFPHTVKVPNLNYFLYSMRFFLSSNSVGLQTQPKKARRISKAGPFCHTLRESRHGQADSFRQEMAEEDIGATGRTKQAVGRNRQLSENDIIH